MFHQPINQAALQWAQGDTNHNRHVSESGKGQESKEKPALLKGYLQHQRTHTSQAPQPWAAGGGAEPVFHIHDWTLSLRQRETQIIKETRRQRDHRGQGMDEMEPFEWKYGVVYTVSLKNTRGAIFLLMHWEILEECVCQRP